MWQPRYDPINYHYAPAIQITSPEQFVPLFLADMLNLDWSIGAVATGIGPFTGTKTRLELEALYNRWFTADIPKAYALPIPNRLLSRPNSIGSVYNVVDCVSLFTGSQQGRIVPAHPYLVNQGFLGTINLAATSGMSSDQYYFTNTYWYPLVRDIVPLILIVVKAKHIPLISASQHLDASYEIPVNDMRLLRTDTQGNNTLSSVVSLYHKQSGLEARIKAEDLVPEFLSKQEVLDFIVGKSVTLSAEEHVKRALAIHKKEIAIGGVLV